MASLEARITQLEEIEAIRALKVHYARLCDDGYDADPLAALFTEDCLWDGGIMGAHEGREAVRRFFAAAPRRVSFALHMMVSHTIDLAPSGTEASGYWYLWQPMTLDGVAHLSAVTYDDEYRKQDGHWLFHRVKVHRHFTTPYDKGWVKQRLPDG